MNRWWIPVKAVVSSLIAVVLVLSLVSCSDQANSEIKLPFGAPKTEAKGTVSEVSPPEVIQQLRQTLNIYKPQVSITSPLPEQVLQDNTVEARFQVQDLPVFKDADLGLGPHLHVFLDNQPYQAVYDLTEPLIFKDLTPGTHTLRVFASRPWHESFKNEGAYAQTTFHIFTKTPNNSPESNLPLLTYSRPQGAYGAEPIMLDFYLTNAPLHFVAQEKADDEIADWRIRVNVNGQSFYLDQWMPIYLKGFKPGKNWVQLEFLDEKGNPVNNVFNNTARLITYEPKGKDGLSKLVRGELSVAQACGIVDPNCKPKLTPTLTPTPMATPEAAPTSTPAVEETPTQIQIQPQSPQSSDVPEIQETQPSEKPSSGNFFTRFRRPATGNGTPSPGVSEIVPPAPESQLQETPELPKTSETEVSPAPTVTIAPIPTVEVAPTTKSTPNTTEDLEKTKYSNYLDRYRHKANGANTSPTPEASTTPNTTTEPSRQEQSPTEEKQVESAVNSGVNLTP